MAVKPTNYQYIHDPLVFAKVMWPDVNFYSKQREIIYSVIRDDKTVVPAAMMMGKDFVAAFITVWFFVTREPCRVITTSAKDEHLDVLWGEVNNFVGTARYAMRVEDGGILQVQHHMMKKLARGKRELCPISYVKGMVASDATMAAMGGHHVADVGDGVPRTLFLADECSHVKDAILDTVEGWAVRRLWIGNTWPCDNEFKKAVEGTPGTDDRGGDVPRDPSDPDSAGPAGKGYHRKVIHITGDDSPNVVYAKAQIASGSKRPADADWAVIQKGVLPYDKYAYRRKMWQPDVQAIGLDARWYKGKDVMLFPDEWLARAELYADELDLAPRKRRAKGIGIDPAEGGDSSDMTAVDDHGVLTWLSLKTPDTDDLFHLAHEFIVRHGLAEDGEHVCIDRGGGGKQLADRLRKRGIMVRTVAFGEPLTPDPKVQTSQPIDERIDEREFRYAYVNRRAYLYGTLSERLDPGGGWSHPWGIPRRFHEFRKQLGPIPRQWDIESRVKLPPKRKKNKDDKTVTLVDLIGHSPDAADSLVLAYYAMTPDPNRPEVGAVYDMKNPRRGANDHVIEVGGIDLYAEGD